MDMNNSYNQNSKSMHTYPAHLSSASVTVARLTDHYSHSYILHLQFIHTSKHTTLSSHEVSAFILSLDSNLFQCIRDRFDYSLLKLLGCQSILSQFLCKRLIVKRCFVGYYETFYLYWHTLYKDMAEYCADIPREHP